MFKVKDSKSLARAYLDTLFSRVDFNKHGEIEIRKFICGGGKPEQLYCTSIDDAVADVLAYRDSHNIFVTVNPGIGGHTKDCIKFVSTFHVDIDYGNTGHKKSSEKGGY